MNIQYLAGFFDGEGCIDNQRMYAKNSNAFYVRPRLRLAQANNGAFILDRIQKEFGGTLTKQRPSKKSQQPSMSWEILNKDGIIHMLEALEPLLIIKQEQARLALWWLKNHSGKQIPELARIAFNDELKRMKRDLQRLSEEAIVDIERLMR